MKTICTFAIFTTLALAAQAVIIQIDLQGKAGTGLLAGNENGTVLGTPGSGGEVGAGITFDDVTNDLTINVGWGSGNGFTDLTGNATAGHIHGFTTSNSPASFLENAGVMIGLNSLGGWNPSATGGGFSGTVNLSGAQETALLNGQLYLNFHTATNSGGEIRGQLMAVPEPASVAAVMAVAALGLVALRRRRTAVC